MKDRRAMRTTGTQLERLLFNAGAAESPDTDTVQKAARALDLFPRALLVGGVLAFVVRHARRASFAVGSLVALGAAAIAGVALIHPFSAPVLVASSRAAPTTMNFNRDPADAAHAPSATRPPALDQALSSSIDTTSPLHHAAARRSKPPALGASPRAASPVDNLREQAETLNRARALLEAGQASSALAVIDDYDHRFQSGQLSEEALLLRVEGLAQRGERTAATDLGRRFLRRYPASMHFDQVVALLGSLSP